MKKSLTILIIVISISAFSQNQPTKERLQHRFKEADSVFTETHQKEFIQLENKINSRLEELQEILNKIKLDYKIKKVFYRKPKMLGNWSQL